MIDIIKYWNDWHNEWFAKLISKNCYHEAECDINGWTIPKSNGGNEYPIWQYFPEPYWANLTTPYRIKGVFLNINPGQGILEQNFIKSSPSSSILRKEYSKKFNGDYCETVASMCSKHDYITTKWMHDKRIKWLRSAMNNKSLTVNDFAFFDLIPWHTKNKSEITNYVDENIHQIIEFVIKPISRFSSQLGYTEFKNKIIVRGSLLLDIINSNKQLQENIRLQDEFVVLNKSKVTSKFNSYLTIINLFKVNFFVFSGGASMLLPPPDYTVAPVGVSGKSKKLKDFLFNYA